MSDKQLSIRQKALKVNLARRFYGTFAEIGAGQEVARQFFQAGGASGSIAKTISAYDMIFSDHIYGKESGGRYVCETRLEKMLAKEYDLLTERLSDVKGKDHQFFVFANTVAALNFQRTNEAHGWLGVRFQQTPGAAFNDVVIHVRMLDPQNILQQDALGIIGVNLTYGALCLNQAPEQMVRELMDHLDSGRIEINFVRVSGPAFKDVDNRLLNLQLVKDGYTPAVMFNEQGEVVLPADYLYKKDVLLVRGSYRPPTLVSMDMIKTGQTGFAQATKIPASEVLTVAEITISTLQEDGEEIANEDFLARVELLCALGQKVLISNFAQYYRLTQYLEKFRARHVGLVLGVYNFKQIFDDEYTNVTGGRMGAMGQLFAPNVHVFVYPYMSQDKKEFLKMENLTVKSELQHLYEHVKASGKLHDIKDFKEEWLHIYSRKVLNMIIGNEEGWEKLVPESVAKTINEKCLFGHPCFLKNKPKK
ncbi:MAG: hypothetical protein K2P81_01375 [Bacteriovoracaceae bacterium]|nr:hypothetical protein [Bacteriovoracaceae bacterium]